MSDPNGAGQQFDRVAELVEWPAEQPLPDLEPVGRPAKGLDLALGELEGMSEPLIVEVGAEFGGSTRTWLRSIDDARVISIDPWPDTYPTHHWPHLTQAVEAGTSIGDLFKNFCWEYRDRLAPLRGTTPSAFLRLRDLGVEPTMIYIDGDHRYEAVFRDLVTADALFPDAIISGDDWRFSSKAKKYRRMEHPVREAVIDFCAFSGYGLLNQENTWLIRRDDAESIPEMRRPPLPGKASRTLEQRVEALESIRAGARLAELEEASTASRSSSVRRAGASAKELAGSVRRRLPRRPS